MAIGQKNRRWIYWILAIFIIFIASFLVWIYSGSASPLKQKFFQDLPLPIALVNWRPIMMSDLNLRVNIGQKSGLGVSQSSIYSQLIKEEEISQLARASDISVSQKQIDGEYATLGVKDSLGLSGGVIKNQIIKPALLLKQLRLWFNSQQNLNEQTYKLADSLLDRINKDSGLMPELAGQFSEDKTGKSVKGDMGFVQMTDLSPELRESVSSMKTGETKIVPGILGLYLFRLEEQHGNQVHLRTIFLNTSDFNVWLNGEFKKFNVINLIK